MKLFNSMTRQKEEFVPIEPGKVKMYEKMGFLDRGISGSSWGGEEWHEMVWKIREGN